VSQSPAKGPQRRLGRGLSALIPGQDEGNENAGEATAGGYRQVPLSLLKTTTQPRTQFRQEALQELADSIRANGILQPILVRSEGDQFVIIAGERRSRAARLAGLTEVPVIVRESTVTEAYELALVENIQRQDLDPIEEALAYQHLVSEVGLTQEQVARRVGKDRATVANALRLLRLPASMQLLLGSGALTAGHARAILTAPEAHHSALADEVVTEGLSVRETERRARLLRDPPPAPPEQPAPPAVSASAEVPASTPAARQPLFEDDAEDEAAPRSPADRAVEDQLRAALGAPVSLRHRQGRGRIELRFSSLAELERLVDLLTSLEGR
jgi:ParB family chromosome partitioning protein